LVGYGINAMISELMITPKPKQLKSIYFNGNGAKKLPWRPRPVYFSPSVSLWVHSAPIKHHLPAASLREGLKHWRLTGETRNHVTQGPPVHKNTPACTDASHFCHAAHLNKPQFSRRIEHKGWESPGRWIYHAWAGWSVAKPFPAKLRESSPDAKARRRRCIRVQHDTDTH